MTNNRKPIFFTSDWHIGHHNVIKFSKRPFRDVDHMSKVLINNYNAIVPPNGVCYFVGDMGLCKADTLTKVVNQLNGTKVLLVGNHESRVNSMYSKGFDVVLYGARIKIAGEMVDVTHCPLRGIKREDTTGMRGSDGTENWHKENKHVDFSVDNKGQFCLHGHIHSPNNGKSTKISGRQFDVGVDANDYRPIAIGRIESWIAKTLQNEKNEKARKELGV